MNRPRASTLSRATILVFFVAFLSATTACSSAATTPNEPDAGEGTTDAGPDGGLPSDVLVIPPGVYEGSSETDGETVSIDAALWGLDDATHGRLIVHRPTTDARAFSLTITGDVATLVPVDGACPSCEPDGWTATLSVSGTSIRLEPQIAAAATHAGIDVLLVPSDGFKPEQAPLGHVLVGGPVTAVDPRFEPAAFASECQLSYDDAGLIAFSCLAEGDWSEVIPESFQRSEATVSWSIRSAEGELTFKGDFSADGKSLTGTVVPSDRYNTSDAAEVDPQDVVGAFAFDLHE